MIRVRILADSAPATAPRLITYELVYPRIIHSELMTYRSFARNASSSRAVPVERMIAAIEADPFIPIAFSGAQRGMAGGPPLQGEADHIARTLWTKAAIDACAAAKKLAAIGVHKQHANRLLEPFAHITTIVSSTDWTRWDRERISDDAQPEIRELAEAMRDARALSVPRDMAGPVARPWHVPSVEPEEYEKIKFGTVHVERQDLLRLMRPQLVAAGRLARTSYLRREETREVVAEIDFALDLERRQHWSPFEHIARPMFQGEIQEGPLVGWRTFRHIEEKRIAREAA